MRLLLNSPGLYLLNMTREEIVMTNQIAFYGKNGVGKTTLVANISASLVEAGFSVLLVGCDFDGGSSSLLRNGEVKPSLLDQTRNNRKISVESAVQSGFKGVGCVEIGNSINNSIEELGTALREFKLSRLVDEVNTDYVIYDIPGDSSTGALSAVTSEIDFSRLFIVTTADFRALQAANEAFAFLEQHNHEDNSLLLMGGLILNNISSSFEETFINNFAYHTNSRIIGKVPRSEVVRQAELYGQTVIESRPQSNQSYFYRRLANQIVDASGAIYSGNLPQPMSAEQLRSWRLEWAEQIYALENGLVTDGAAI